MQWGRGGRGVVGDDIMDGVGAILWLLELLWDGDIGSGVMAECDLLVGVDIPEGNIDGREGDDAEKGLDVSIEVSLSDSSVEFNSKFSSNAPGGQVFALPRPMPPRSSSPRPLISACICKGLNGKTAVTTTAFPT